jgi:phage-related minor tail protein
MYAQRGAVEDVSSMTQEATDRTDDLAEAERLVGEQMIATAANAAELTRQTRLAAQAAMDAAREWTTMQSLRSRFAGEDIAMGQTVVTVGQGDPIPKKPKSAGGGGGRSNRDALAAYKEALDRQRQMLTLTEDQQTVYAALKNDVDKYTQAQIDGAIDATAALRRQEEVLQQQRELWDHVGSTIQDGIMSMIDGAESVEEVFKNMAKSIINELFKVLVLQRLIGSVGGGGLIGKLSGGFADGAAFQGGNVVPFAKGGVVGGPTLFPMSQGTGLMGESGPEAIVPLSRGPDGKLGVGASPVNITVENHGGGRIDVQEDTNGDLRIVIAAVQAVKADFPRSMASGQGVFARSLEHGYAARRRAV